MTLLYAVIINKKRNFAMARRKEDLNIKIKCKTSIKKQISNFDIC